MTYVKEFLFVVLLVLSGNAFSDARAEQSATHEACNTPQHQAFDFWVGEWLVHDANSGELIAVDKVEKQLDGCLIVQYMIWVSDQFRSPDFNKRLSGKSFTAFRNGKWTMMWVDVYGGLLLVEGQADENGTMVFATPANAGRHVRGVWAKQPDGTVRNTGYSSADGKGDWKVYFDYIYRPNN